MVGASDDAETDGLGLGGARAHRPHPRVRGPILTRGWGLERARLVTGGASDDAEPDGLGLGGARAPLGVVDPRERV